MAKTSTSSLVDAITQDGHEVVDMPTCQNNDKACDYPDIAYPISIAVAESQEIDRGVLICGTGIGMCIAANKVKGVRAALVHDEIGAKYQQATQRREHPVPVGGYAGAKDYQSDRQDLA